MNKKETDTIKDYIELNNKFLLSEIQGGNDLLKGKLNELINHQRKVNGQVSQNSEKLQRIWCNPALKPVFKRPYLFIISGILLILIILGFISVPQIFDILKLIK